jgi:hypothetical protein
LEGFSLSVAVVIGFAQLNFAFGLVPERVYKKFYGNFWLTCQNLADGQLEGREFGPFLVFFILLMYLMWWKPKMPWIILVALVGCIYGGILSVVSEGTYIITITY